MKNVAIIGGSGYTGGDLIRLLSGHPYVRLAAISSRRFESQPLGRAFPGFQGLLDLDFSSPSEIIESSEIDLVFTALEHTESMSTVASILESGKKVVDLSADFRFKDAEIYRKWYGTTHSYPHLLSKAVYGLPEVFRKKIGRTNLCANPGCYATAVILGLLPLAVNSLLPSGSIIADAKSGVSGAGRTPKDDTVFCECNEGLRAYSVAGHRHQPEMEQILQGASGTPLKLLFAPHLVPLNRGIMASIYLEKRISLSEAKEAYEEFYRLEPFVLINPLERLPGTQDVRGSNYCRIGLAEDSAGDRLVIITVLDNLVKGASGQAVQNMNIMLDIPEESGLLSPAIFP